MTLVVLMAVAVLLCAVGLALTLVNLRVYAPPPEPDPALATTLVAVAVPARNEEGNIEACLRGLFAQTHPSLRVLVYDDQSTDGTPAILARLAAQEPRLTIVPTKEKPQGWNGKQFACDTMGRFAAALPEAERPAYILFTDADVRFEPACMARTLAAATALGTASLSTFPRQLTRTLAEHLAVPMIHFILFSYLPMPRMRSTTDPATSAGCGQFLFVRTDAYIAAGGHAAIKDSMHDGIKLTRAVRRAGFKTDLFDGQEFCRVRMYTGLAQTWRGFAKNAYEGLGSLGLLLFVTAVHLVGHVAPPVVLLWATLLSAGADSDGLSPRRALAAGLAAAAWILAVVTRGLLAKRFGQDPIGMVLHPLAVMMMTAIQWHSFVLHATGRRQWKGRTA